MKFGVVFPQTEIGADPNIIKDYVQTAEGLGYDYLLTYDHVLGANPDRPGGWKGPYTYEHQFHEPMVLFGYMAALTEKIEFVTGILILPQRQTALVAKQAAQVDVLSGGRLRLGIGIGWNQVEYQSLKEDFSNRGRRIEEQVALLREFWTNPLVIFAGEHHTIVGAGINPMPIQRPIPIWFGGGADVVLRRTAEIGDGWMPNAMPLDKATEMIEKLHRYLEEAERDPKTFGLDVRVSMKQHEKTEWARVVKQWQSLGATHLSVNTMGAGFTPQQHIQAIREFKEAIE
jgi:probable F420-dependent oxidoreductase